MDDFSFKPKNNILNSYLALSRFYSTYVRKRNIEKLVLREQKKQIFRKNEKMKANVQCTFESTFEEK